MAFSTRYYKNVSVFLAFILVCFSAFAGESNIQVSNATLAAEGDAYHLNVDMEMDLDEDIEEAINKGVLVEFLYEFELVSPRTFWFDKEVALATTSVNVSYHALSRQYLVSHGERQTSHELLSEALHELMQLRDWAVFNQAVIESDEAYSATLNVTLDQDKLPKAIQVEAISSEDWNIVAETYEWIPEALKQ